MTSDDGGCWVPTWLGPAFWIVERPCRTVVANFHYDPEFPLEGEQVTFDATDSYSLVYPLLSWEWDYGHGIPVFGSEVERHNYYSENLYKVKLNVANDIGKVDTEEKYIIVESGQQLTDELKPLIISEEGKTVKVKPKIVIEVSYEEIQKSPTYSSGYALRFPRLVNLRTDRKANDCSTLDLVESFYFGQNK